MYVKENYMVSLNMNGPFRLTQNVIEKIIPDNVIGNYAYGNVDETGTFVVQYVGRSDNNLKERIGHGIGNYEYFKFSIASSPLDAYHKECKNYHDFGGDQGLLDNEIHPDKPNHVFGICPICTKRILDKISIHK